MGTDIYIPALPLMVKEFNSTPNVVNLTISIYTIGVAVFVLFASALGNRFGRKPVIALAVGIFSLTSYLIALSPSIWLIVFLRLLQSMIAFVFICSRQVLKDIMDQREQVRANGIILSGLVISPAIAPVIGAYLTHFVDLKIFNLFMGRGFSLFFNCT